MTCSNCGRPLVEGARFCASCGSPVGVPLRSTLSISATQLIGGIVAVAILSALMIGAGVWLGSRTGPPVGPTAVAPSLAVVPTASAAIASQGVFNSPSPSAFAPSPSPSPSPTTTPTPTRKPTPRPSVIAQTLGTGEAPFVYDSSSPDSLYSQEHQYLYHFIKPCPRAGCETATLDPRFAWTLDYEAPIPAEFQPCLTNPDGVACYRAVTGS
jgi:hypothetical protein